MQTLLSRFCEEFVRIIQPVLAPLSSSAEAISRVKDGPHKKLQPQLVDLRHQMEQLSEKVSAQQAYVLIFGPLKSGKSTMMNAIAGSYVSEVSSLPAYPCMVFVSHAPKKEFVLCRYRGTPSTFSTAAELKTTVDVAHTELAAKIRSTEKGGGEFDPRVHFQDAISRIDVKVPTNELSQSRAVLVDTPGLYSRMKFGYDRMTREFRNTAACAIFVVRSDNLFLDQVFAEFTDLLELFSRIFLVVNIDSAKRDLSPEGELVPALEQQDPKKIIEAFQSLVMSAPLKEAADEGRLRIYPVDLLHAAQGRLGTKAAKSPNGNGNGNGASKGHENGAPGSDFDGFLKDLTEYLNSSDYLVSFLGDSLRRATALIDETAELCTKDDVRKLRDKVRETEKLRVQEETRRQSIERLEGAGWNKRFEALGKELAAACEGIADDIGQKTARGVTETCQAWFKSKRSLHDLVKKDLSELFTSYQDEVIAAVSRELSERLVKTGMGVPLPDQLRDALKTAEIDLVSICRDAHGETDREALVVVPPTPLRTDHFQVKRKILDWLMLRSPSAMQRRLFGPIDNPALSIPSDVKASRLGDPAKKEMKRRLDGYQKKFYADTVERIVDGFARGYCKLVLDELMRRLKKARTRVENKLIEYDLALSLAKQLLEPLDELHKHAKTAQGSLKKLTRHYDQVDLYLLTQPVAPGFRLPEDAPDKAAKEPNRVIPAVPPAPKEANRVTPATPPAAKEPNRVTPAKPPAAKEPNRVIPAKPPAAKESNRVIPAKPPASKSPATPPPASSPIAKADAKDGKGTTKPSDTKGTKG